MRLKYRARPEGIANKEIGLTSVQPPEKRAVNIILSLPFATEYPKFPLFSEGRLNRYLKVG